MGVDRMAFGRWGEEEAVRVLKRNGYRIIEKNYRCRHGEIDIVAMDGGTIVFVEVKTRGSDLFGTPKCGVDGRKKRHMIAASESYIQLKGLFDEDVRFDVVSIERKGEGFQAEIVKNAFEA